MRTYVTLLLAVALGLLCSIRPALADHHEDFARSGLYLGVGGLHVFEKFDLPEGSATVGGAPVALDLDADGLWGIDSHIGYRFHPHGAAEVQVQYFDFGVDLHVSGAVALREQVATVNAFAVSTNGKLYPLTGRFQPYALGGIGFVRLSLDDSLGLGVSDTETAFAGRIGGGVDAYLTRNIVANAEVTYVLPTADLSDFQMVPVSVGIQYRF